MKYARIAVCIPLGWEYVPRPFFLNCIGMMDRAQKSGRYELQFITDTACYLDKCRDTLVVEAKKRINPHYYLWLDADQLYPHDTPEILMRHVKSGCLVVGGATPRRDNGIPLIYEFTKPGDDFMCRPIMQVLNRGLIQVDALGFGGVMVHSKVFDRIPAPRFKMWWSTANEVYVGEDIEFYRLCREHGIKVWCDTNLHYGHLTIKPVLFNKKWKGEEDNG